MPVTLLTRRADQRAAEVELLRTVRLASDVEQVAAPDVDPAQVRADALAELSRLLGLPVANVRHQPPAMANTARTPYPVPTRLYDERGSETHLAWYVSVAGYGTIVLTDSAAVTSWPRLDRWRSQVRPEASLPLLTRARRECALQLFHQLHAMTEIESAA